MRLLVQICLCISHFSAPGTDQNLPTWKPLDLYLRGKEKCLNLQGLIYYYYFFNSLLMMEASHAWAKWAAPHMVLQPWGMSVSVSSKSTVCPHPSCRIDAAFNKIWTNERNKKIKKRGLLDGACSKESDKAEDDVWFEPWLHDTGAKALHLIWSYLWLKVAG